MYNLVMFPYPSGSGLHVGHAYNYAIVDSYSRWQRYNGVEVFQPFGYDAFGLPAENYARKHGRDPREVTYENIATFRGQMDHMNTSYDDLLVTSDEEYYVWTQWLFTKLHEHGLAYKKVAPVNYCDSCETVLANEQVVDERCERCKSKVELKELNQWFFKITDYKDRLIANLDWIDYPESTIKQQRHWLEDQTDWCVSRQRKWGCPIPIEGEEDTLDTFVDSSFYYLRYLDPNNPDELFAPEKYKQVDLYVGGREHSCMHLIYARFINMFLFDIGVVPEEEPFKKVFHQGVITVDGKKMSKNQGTVVNPDDYDPDELRLYLMFIGPYDQGGDWNDKRMKGITKFIARMKVWLGAAVEGGESLDLTELRAEINRNIERNKVNLVVSSMMKFNKKNKSTVIDTDTAKAIADILRCFAPGFEY
jgi:leucyl-tRNA synthetase